MEILKSDITILILIGLIFILFILVIANMVRIKKIKKEYAESLNKLGNGENLAQMLKSYIEQVERLDKKDDEIIEFCQKINDNFTFCIQKVGLVRYNAFSDTGSNLSFSLAMLDKKNTGIVLNGIYGRDSSNIYAKPVIEGKSTYRLAKEEEEAIQKAIQG